MKMAARALLAVVVLALVAASGVLAGAYLGSGTPENEIAEATVLDGPATPVETKGAALDAPVAPTETESDSVATAGGIALPGSISEESQNLLEAAKGEDTGELIFGKTKDGEFFKMTFSQLASFEYALPDRDEVLARVAEGKELDNQIPEAIKALDGEKVLIVGYMVPIDVKPNGDIVEFALTENQMFCCFGVPPAMNEWLLVDMEGDTSTEFFSDMPVGVYGTIEMGEEILDGYIMSIYRMVATEVVDVKEILKRAGKADPTGA